MENMKNGIWQFSKEIQTGEIPDNSGLPDTYTFIYTDDTLILKLPTVSTLINKPPDDVYCLPVKWKLNNMYFFPPFGIKWELFALWENNTFIMKGVNKIKVFKKIPEAEVVDWNKDLLTPDRKKWKYDRTIPEFV